MQNMDGSETHEILRLQNPDIKILVASGVFYFGNFMEMSKSMINSFYSKTVKLLSVKKQNR